MATSKAPILVLETLQLIRDSQTGKLDFEALGAVQHADGSPTHLPQAMLGLGAAVPVPPAFQALFPGLLGQAIDGTALFFEMPDTGAPQAGSPAWFVSIGTAGITLVGVQPLNPGALTAPGLLAFANLTLQVAMQTKGEAITAAEVVVLADAAVQGSLGPVAQAGLSVQGQVKLSTTIKDLGSAGAVLAEPERLLDGAFDGTLHLQASSTGFDLGGLRFGTADLTFDLHVSSPAGARQLQLDGLDFHLSAPNALSLGAASLSQLKVDAHSDPGGRLVTLHGQATLGLPADFKPVLAAGGQSLTIPSLLDLRHTVTSNQQHTQIDLDVSALSLNGGVNALGLSSADLKLRAVNDGSGWQLTLRGAARQSWSGLASWLRAQRILDLPGSGSLPDLYGTLDIVSDAAANTPGCQVAIQMAFLAPGSTAPFRGALGPLPVIIGDAALRLQALIPAAGQPSWQVAGVGEISTTGFLRDVVPLDAVRCQIQAAQSAGSALPVLAFSITGGLPALALPAFTPGGQRLTLFQLDTLSVRLGSSLDVRGAVRLPGFQAAGLAASLGLPDWKDMLTALASDIPNQGTFSISLPLGSSGPGLVEVVLQPSSPAGFRLFDVLKSVLPNLPLSADLVVPQDLGGGKIAIPLDFFAVRPDAIRFRAAFGEQTAIQLAAALQITLFGETFDATMTLSVVEGEPEFSLLAGHTDPIRVSIPVPDLSGLLQGLPDAQIHAIAGAYQINDQDLKAVQQELLAFFSAPGGRDALVFEARDFGLTLRANQTPQVSGTLHPLQFPGLLQKITPAGGFDLGLGASPDKIFISVEIPAAAGPLFTLPEPGHPGGQIRLVLHSFMLAYAWASNDFAFKLDAEMDSDHPLDLTAGGSGLYVPDHTHVDVSLGATATAPPVPIVEWLLSFDSKNPASMADALGLQIIAGTTTQRFVTLQLHETRFSPSYLPFCPGLTFDGGVVLGGPDPRAVAVEALEDYLKEAQWNDSFYARFIVHHLLLLEVNPVLGYFLNPFAFALPFGLAMPPYWILPPSMMGDVYADLIDISLNIPALVRFQFSLKRPMPKWDMQMLLELAALAGSGFTAPVAGTSPLRELLYIDLNGSIEIPLVNVFSGNPPSLAFDLPFNAVKLVDAAQHVFNAIRDTLTGAADALQTFQQNPDRLVEMIPQAYRRFTFDSTAEFALAGLSLHGSLFLLTSRELGHELVLFFENRRPERKGLAALPEIANQPAAPAPNTQPTNQAPLSAPLAHHWSRHEVTNPETYWDPASDIFNGYVQSKVGSSVQAHNTVYASVDSIKRQEQDAWRQAIRETGRRYLAQPLNQAVLLDALHRYGLDALQGQILDLGRQMLPLPLGRGLPLDAFTEAVLGLIANQPLYTLYPGLKASPDDLADKIVARTASTSPFPPPLPHLPPHLPPRPGPIGLIQPARIGGGPRILLAEALVPGPALVGGQLTVFATPASGTPLIKFQFSASLPVGAVQITRTTWDFGDGTSQAFNGMQLGAAHTYAQTGSFTVSVTLECQSGGGGGVPGGGVAGPGGGVVVPRALPTGGCQGNLTGSTQVTVSAPAVSIAASPSPAPVNTPVQCGALPNFPANLIVAYQWSTSDGQASTAAAPSFTFTRAGDFTLNLKVTLQNNTSLSAAKQVTVQQKCQLFLQPLSQRQAVYADLLPAADLAALAAAIEPLYSPVAQGASNPNLTCDQAGGLLDNLRAKIAALLRARYPGVRDNFATDAAYRADPASIEQTIRQALATTPQIQQVAFQATTFDPAFTNQLLSKVPGTFKAEQPGAGVVTVRQPDGYQVQLRSNPGGAALAANAPFSAPAPSARASYKVQMLGGRYHVLVEQPDGRWQATRLPDALASSVAESPEKANTLREQLVIAPRFTDRPATPEEAAAVSLSYEADPALYLQSALARPEYQVRPDGGIHGPFFIGGLFARPGVPGGYITPGGPALLAGVKVDLFKNLLGQSAELGLAGLVLATGDAADPYDIFLHGYGEIHLPLGGFNLYLEGQFTAIDGKLWLNSPLDAQAGAGTMAQRALNISGFASFGKDSRAPLFMGQVRGSLAQDAQGQWRCHTNVQISFAGSIDFELGDTQLAKVSYRLSGSLSVDADERSGSYSLTSHLSASVDVEIPDPTKPLPTKTVTVTPETTVCVPVPEIAPPGLHTECVTIPAVTAQVPDLSAISWQKTTVSAGVDVQLSTANGLQITLDVGTVAGVAVGQIEVPKLI